MRSTTRTAIPVLAGLTLIVAGGGAAIATTGGSAPAGGEAIAPVEAPKAEPTEDQDDEIENPYDEKTPTVAFTDALDEDSYNAEGGTWTVSQDEIEFLLQEQLGTEFAQVDCGADLTWGALNSVRCTTGEGEYADTTWTVYPTSEDASFKPGGLPSLAFMSHTTQDQDPLDPLTHEGITDPETALTHLAFSEDFNTEDLSAAEVEVAVQETLDETVGRPLTVTECFTGLDADVWGFSFCQATTHDGETIELWTRRAELADGQNGLMVGLKSFH